MDNNIVVQRINSIQEFDDFQKSILFHLLNLEIDINILMEQKRYKSALFLVMTSVEEFYKFMDYEKSKPVLKFVTNHDKKVKNIANFLQKIVEIFTSVIQKQLIENEKLSQHVEVVKFLKGLNHEIGKNIKWSAIRSACIYADRNTISLRIVENTELVLTFIKVYSTLSLTIKDYILTYDKKS